MPIEDLVLERLSGMYPSERPKLWEANMKAAIKEYRKVLLENSPSENFEDAIKEREVLATMLHNSESN